MLRESEEGAVEALDHASHDDGESTPYLRLVPADSEPPDSHPLETYEAEPEEDARPQLCFEELYERYFDDVYRSLALLGVPMATREDAAQDVFVVVHRRLADFEGRSTARTWILGITRRVASHHRRSGYREWRRRDAWSREQRGRSTSLDGVIENQEAAEILEAFLDTLPQEQREAFVLGAVQGLGRAEIGEALGINPNTAYSRLRLARGRFKERVLDPEAQAQLLADWRRQQRSEGLRARVWSLLPVAITGGTQGGLAFGKLQASLKGIAVGFALALPLAIGALELSIPEDVPASRSAAVVMPDVDPLEPAKRATKTSRVRPEPLEWHPHVEPTPLAELEPTAGATPSRARTSAPRAESDAELGQLDAELTLLRRAQDAHKREDFAAAQAALEAHSRAFPKGRLSVDRDFLLALIACEPGDPADTALALQRFAAAHPDAPQLRSLRSRCGASR